MKYHRHLSTLDFWQPSTVENPKIILFLCFSLHAANRTLIETLGTKMVPLHLGNHTFEHNVVVARIGTSVLKWDFLRKYQLSVVVWQGPKK